MRVTISGGKLYYFANGDLVGSGNFTKPTADKCFIKGNAGFCVKGAAFMYDFSFLRGWCQGR